MTEPILPRPPHGERGLDVPSLPSLPEVHASIPVPTERTFWRKMLAFSGPAYLVSVGYMDPGNWATDIEGGARFGYRLIWVLLLSNLLAILLQTLSARLGIVTGRDLAQACRDFYPKPVAFALWLFCEIAIAACDLAEVLGGAVGLNLLFPQVPLIAAVCLMACDVILILFLQHRGMRLLEAIIVSLVASIGFCYLIEMFFAHPDWLPMLKGFVPKLTGRSAEPGVPSDLYIAMGILGATVMPHNLYLHSALVQTRRVERTDEGVRTANKFNLIDSVVALNCAFFVNAAILVMAAAVFYRHGVVVTELKQAYQTLSPLVGHAAASTLFAVALICSGQSSTLTGTLAGQIVMEGFLHIRLQPWLRRLITRLLAIVPAIIVIAMQGEQGSYKLLILSQVILSIQLPFAVVPLVQFTSSRAKMGKFVNPPLVKLLAWFAAALIIGLNLWLLKETISGWVSGT
ncbi:MAG: Nramp family divalent metal transporter [Verrucomicrobiia bacterium]